MHLGLDSFPFNDFKKKFCGVLKGVFVAPEPNCSASHEITFISVSANKTF